MTPSSLSPTTLRGRPLLDGWRGAPPADVEALAAAIVAMSRLALHEGASIAEAEINPLLVRAHGAGVVALDALLIMEAQ